MATQDIYQAVLDLNKAMITKLVTAELEAGTDVLTILNNGLIAALDEVGRRFSDGTIFVPEMLLAAKVVESGLDILRPLLVEKDVKPIGTVVIGTVEGDMHDIGKNVVAMMLEGSGFKVLDLGVDVKPSKFVAAAMENQANIVGLSALLTTTMPAMAETVRMLKEQSPKIKTLVGGAPVTKDFADKIGADGFGQDAPGAVDVARNLVRV